MVILRMASSRDTTPRSRTKRDRNEPIPIETIITPIIAKITDSTAPSIRPAVLASRYS